MIHNKMKSTLLLILYLFSLIAFAGGSNEKENSANTEFTLLIDQLSDEFFNNRLTVDMLEYQLSATANQAENKVYWYLESSQYNFRCTAKASEKKSTVDKLEIYTNDLTQLTLKELETIFGKSSIQVISKDAWVEFTGPSRHHDPKVSVTANLYGHPNSGDAPVTSLQLSKD